MVRPVALIFDVFGTLVDWRTSIARQVAAAFAAKGKSVDATGFADLWRAQYDPSMDPIRSGSRAYIALDHLHLESLATVLTAYKATSFFTASEQRDLARAWERLDPWPDSAVGPMFERVDCVDQPLVASRSFSMGLCSGGANRA
jgi:2-haloacid dehalogenase